jgi:glycerophosphoryl diester phosphodiesterase
MRTKKLSTLAAGLALSLAACSPVNERPVENLNNGRINVMGHAGSGFESALNPYPSNTLTSIRQTLEGYNADGTELDVQLTQDSSIVLYHDGTLESMTECAGYPYETPVATLTGCRYRTDFNSHILQDEHLITLEDVLGRYQNSPLQPRYDFDLKVPEVPNLDHAQFRARFARRLAATVARYGGEALLPRIDFGSGEVELLLAVRQQLPNARLYLDSDDFEQALSQINQHNFTGLIASNASVTAEQVKRAHAAGRQVTLFSVIRRTEMIEAVDKDPDAIEADNILLLQQILAARYGR